jgi:hypothetical protein
MKINIKVKPNSQEQKIEQIDGLYIVNLKSPPVENKANLELIHLLKKYFKRDVKIISGFSSRKKIIEVPDN